MEADQIGELLCGKKPLAKFEKDGTYYFETTNCYYKVLEFVKGYWTVSKMTVVGSDAVTDWVLSMPFNYEVMKKLFKILNS